VEEQVHLELIMVGVVLLQFFQQSLPQVAEVVVIALLLEKTEVLAEAEVVTHLQVQVVQEILHQQLHHKDQMVVLVHLHLLVVAVAEVTQSVAKPLPEVAVVVLEALILYQVVH
jgi:hypothetical protein